MLRLPGDSQSNQAKLMASAVRLMMMSFLMSLVVYMIEWMTALGPAKCGLIEGLVTYRGVLQPTTSTACEII